MGQILAPFPSENDSTILRKLFAKSKKGAQWLSGRVLDSRQRAAGSNLTGVTVMCP